MAQVYNTIPIKGRGITDEGIAGGTISPGDLVVLDSAGHYIRHATAKGAAVPLFATENELFGKDLSVDYVVNDNVVVEAAKSGHEIFATIAAAAAAIAIGDQLESAGDGTLRKITATSQSGTTPFAVTFGGSLIAVAQEAIDNSGGGTKVRVRVQIR